jgi:(2Fe-2S) ferredoxin
MTEAMASPVKLRVCQGSSCLSKCRGSFSPLNSFEELRKNDDAPIEIEETYCMNQCKRGPNMRMIKDGNALIFEDSMNDTEMKRKAFQGVTTDEKVAHLFGIAKGATDGSNPGVESGSVEKLNDIMPS